jgi:SH3 domain protein
MFDRLIVLFLLLLICIPALSQTIHYVSDNLEAPLRAGPSMRYKIIGLLPSGAALSVLQSDGENGYSRVQTDEGVQGWILTRYTVATPLPEDNLAGTRQALEALKAENASLKKQLDILIPTEGKTPDKLRRLSDENQRLSQELAYIHKIANSDIDLDDYNKKLQKRVVELEYKLQIARQENQFLADNKSNILFMLGAGVLLIGLMLGWMISRPRSHRRDSWSEL